MEWDPSESSRALAPREHSFQEFERDVTQGAFIVNLPWGCVEWGPSEF